MIVNNLIDKHRFEFNFDQEIRLESEDEVSSGDSKARVYKLEETFYTPSNTTETPLKISERDYSIVFSSDHIFIHQNGKGIKKLIKKDGLNFERGHIIKENTSLFSGSSC